MDVLREDVDMYSVDAELSEGSAIKVLREAEA
jgi:hypothetical protein